MSLAVLAKALFKADWGKYAAVVEPAVGIALAHTNRRLTSPVDPQRFPVRSTRQFNKAMSDLDAIVYKLIADRRASKEDHGDLVTMLHPGQGRRDGGHLRRQADPRRGHGVPHRRARDGLRAPDLDVVPADQEPRVVAAAEGRGGRGAGRPHAGAGGRAQARVHDHGPSGGDAALSAHLRPHALQPAGGRGRRVPHPGQVQRRDLPVRDSPAPRLLGQPGRLRPRALHRPSAPRAATARPTSPSR